MATLESIAAQQDMILSEVQRVREHLDTLNGRTRTNEVCIARLQEQVNFRTAALGFLTLVAAGLGITIR